MSACAYTALSLASGRTDVGMVDLALHACKHSPNAQLFPGTTQNPRPNACET